VECQFSVERSNIGSGGNCKLGLTIVRPNLLSMPEMLSNWTDDCISCRQLAPTSFLAKLYFPLWWMQWQITSNFAFTFRKTTFERDKERAQFCLPAEYNMFLQQICVQQMWDSFVERRYFKFQHEIQFSSNTIMEQLKHCDSDSFCGCNMSCFY